MEDYFVANQLKPRVYWLLPYQMKIYTEFYDVYYVTMFIIKFQLAIIEKIWKT